MKGHDGSAVTGRAATTAEQTLTQASADTSGNRPGGGCC